MKNIILTITALLITNLGFANVEMTRSIASIKQDIRVNHARELLGNRYKKSIVSTYEKHNGLEKNIFEIVESRLPKKFKHRAGSVASTIIKEAAKHSMDPYFIMAVISGESSFNPTVVGPVGEIGMMQIRPTTGEWMAKKINMKWFGEKSLQDPVINIKLGTAYIAWLREKFDNQSQLYLAAYNMGAKSVRNAVGRNIWPKDYPKHVMKRYLAFYKEI